MVDGVVYVGTEDDYVYALNAAAGSIIWSYGTGDEVNSSPAVANGIVYVEPEDNNVYAWCNCGSRVSQLSARFFDSCLYCTCCICSNRRKKEENRWENSTWIAVLENHQSAALCPDIASE